MIKRLANQESLESFARKFLKEKYGMSLTVPIRLNGRLSSTLGRFCFASKGNGSYSARAVEVNRHFYETGDPKAIVDVLKHELVHYAMFMQGRNFDDGHPEFERELKRLGVVSQDTINKYSITPKPRMMRTYECAGCGQEYNRWRSLPNGGRGHRCGKSHCGGELLDKGRKLITFK